MYFPRGFAAISIAAVFTIREREDVCARIPCVGDPYQPVFGRRTHATQTTRRSRRTFASDYRAHDKYGSRQDQRSH